MRATHVIFSHGKESGPFGRKIRRLIGVAEQLGLGTTSVDYRECANADKRIMLLRDTIASLQMPTEDIVLVGSSMGGYVSMAAANELPVAGLFLMAPALWMPAEEYTVQSYSPKTARIEITHGFGDDIVPYENSVRFAANHRGTTLHLVDDDHRLGESHDFLAKQFRRFLNKFAFSLPIKNSFLVDAELNIYAGEYPGDKDETSCRTKLAHFAGKITHFIDLTEEGELSPYAQYLNADQSHFRFPIRDVSIPHGTTPVHHLIYHILQASRNGGRTYIHCWGGVGRTGTIVACLYAFLMRDKASSASQLYNLAMQRLQSAFSMCPKSKYRETPETDEQRKFIRSFIEKELMP